MTGTRYSYPAGQYRRTEIREGLSGRGHKVFLVQATKCLQGGRIQQVSECFTTHAEAESWIKHAMPCNDYTM